MPFITTSPTAPEIEKAFLVGVELKTPSRPENDLGFTIEDSLEELAALAMTAEIEVVGGTFQRLEKYNPGTLIGKGKVDELKTLKDELRVDLFIFDEELSPRQLRVLENTLDCKILDRTALILDIFARHAQTREGQLQVELAQYEYRLPRLTRMWTHLARQAGGRAGGATGGVGVRGPGETQLEVDRRLIQHRISELKKELEKVRDRRFQHRRQRKQVGLPVVAIVGYTNAGKSTLLNAVSGSDVLEADMLFATLDPTTRRVKLPGGLEVLFTDTVGFIQKLPPQLIAAFRATLEEINEADLILHVVDITHPNALEQAATVEKILRDLEATDCPVLLALNKTDQLSDNVGLEQILRDYPNSVALSAREKLGIDTLFRVVEETLNDSMVQINVLLPYAKGELLSLMHRFGRIEKEEPTAKGIRLAGRVPRSIESEYREFRY